MSDNVKPASGCTGPSSCSGFSVEPRFWGTRLEDAPPGLFRFGDTWGFKTEYEDDNGPEAYCVESGEYFWGGVSGDREARRKLIVYPAIICPTEN